MFKRKPKNQPYPQVRFNEIEAYFEAFTWTSANSQTKWVIVSFDTAASFVDNGALIDDASYKEFLEIRAIREAPKDM